MNQFDVDGDVRFLYLIAFVAMVMLTLLAFVMLALVARPWLRAFTSGAPVSVLSILGMRMRGNSPLLVIDAYIALRRASVNATIVDVEGAYIDHRTRVRTHEDLIELVKSAVGSRDAER